MRKRVQRKERRNPVADRKHLDVEMTLTVEGEKEGPEEKEGLEESRQSRPQCSARHGSRGGSGKQAEPREILQDLVTNGHMRMKMAQEMKTNPEEETGAGQFGGCSQAPSPGL